jgi:hypothetical protein
VLPGAVRVAADPVVLWFRVGTRATSSVPDAILVAFVMSRNPLGELIGISSTMC